MAKKCKACDIRKQNSEYRQKFNSGSKLPKEVRQRQKQIQRQMKKR